MNASQLVLLPFNSKPVTVLCHVGDFGCGAGAWTLVMKMDGNKVWYSLISGCTAHNCCIAHRKYKGVKRLHWFSVFTSDWIKTWGRLYFERIIQAM